MDRSLILEFPLSRENDKADGQRERIAAVNRSPLQEVAASEADGPEHGGH